MIKKHQTLITEPDLKHFIAGTVIYRTLNETKYEYYCSNCHIVLKETETNLSLAYLVESCPSCGSMLSNSLQERSNMTKVKQEILFQPASKIPQLKFDIEKLDLILNFLRPNQIIAITGYRCQNLVERLCIRAQLPKRHGGLDSNAIVIDGGNSSDPYLSINFARQYGLHVHDALSKIITSRAFTIHQLSNLVTYELQNVISKHDAKLLVVSDLLYMFSDDPFLDKNEAKLILQDIMDSISQIQERITIVSISKPTQYDGMIYKLFDKIITITKLQHRVLIQVDNRESVQIMESELESIPQR